MQKILKRVICVITFYLGFSSLQATTTNEPTPIGNSGGIFKINEDLYVAKLPEKDFYFVMQRIRGTSPAKDFWRNTAKSVLNIHKEGNFSTAGSNRFNELMNNTNFDRDDVWVAFLSNQMMPPYASRNVRIFVSVVTRPGALMSTHMGISKVEGKNQMFPGFNTPPNISMPLHSFAAKVTHMLYPSVRFMVTTPVGDMVRILTKAIPSHALHLGTVKEYHIRGMYLESRTSKSIEEFKQTAYGKYLNEKMEKENHSNRDEEWEISFNAPVNKEDTYDSQKKSPPIIDFYGNTNPRKFVLYEPNSNYKILAEVKEGDGSPNSYIFHPYIPPRQGEGTNFAAIDIDSLANLYPVDPNFKP